MKDESKITIEPIEFNENEQLVEEEKENDIILQYSSLVSWFYQFVGFFALYHATLFQPYRHFSVQTSLLLLIGMLLCCLAIEFLLGMYGEKNINFFRGLLNGFGLYTLHILPYMSEHTSLLLKLLMLLSGGYLIGCFIICLIRKKINIKSICKSLHTVFKLFSLGSLIFFLGLGRNFFVDGMFYPREENYSKYYVENEFDVEELAIIETEQYKLLGESERVSLFNQFYETENNNLGFDQKLTLKVGNLDEPYKSQFDRNCKILTLDRRHLMEDDPYEVIETIVHELYHYYQYRLITLYERGVPCKYVYLECFSKLHSWGDELRLLRRTVGYDNLCFENTLLEADAKEYTEMRLQTYREFIKNQYDNDAY